MTILLTPMSLFAFILGLSIMALSFYQIGKHIERAKYDKGFATYVPEIPKPKPIKLEASYNRETKIMINYENARIKNSSTAF